MEFVIGEGRSLVEFMVQEMGKDLVVTIGGGVVHVGAIAVAYVTDSIINPGEKTVTANLITLPGHKEESIAIPLAGKLARNIGRNCVLVLGIHIDDIKPDEIENISANCEAGIEKIISNYKEKK